MDNILDDILNKIDELKRRLYRINKDIDETYKRLNEFEEYVQSIKELK